MLNFHIFRILTIFTFIYSPIFFDSYIYAKSENEVYDSIHIYTSKYLWAIEKQKEFPEESFVIFEDSYAFFKDRKDTTKTIISLINMSDITRNKGEFALTFDYLWEALYLSKESNILDKLAIVHRKLSTLYNFFGMNKDAMVQLQNAIDVSKQIYTKGDNNTAIQLNVSYLNLAFKKRQIGNLEEALVILDSCILDEDLLNKSIWYWPAYESERANILIELGRIEDARKSIAKAQFHTTKDNYIAHTLINRRKAELYEKIGKTDSAIFFYNHCLSLIKNFKPDENQKAEILEKLANIYYAQRNNKRAFIYLQNSKAISDSLLEIRSNANNKIFKINNTYHEALQQKEATIKEKNQIIQNKTEVQLRLKIIIALLLALIGTFALVLRLRSRLKKTVKDQENTKAQAALEKEQNQSQIKLKNQELTSYALQLVDKESSVKELLNTIKHFSKEEFKKLEGKYKTGAHSLWEEFNMRFTEVNSDFYDRLTTRCPELSRTEQKHCALIKLNFSTKEMAQILNVEAHTINMSRSRIRKKLGLERDVNLSNYIGEI